MEKKKRMADIRVLFWLVACVLLFTLYMLTLQPATVSGSDYSYIPTAQPKNPTNTLGAQSAADANSFKAAIASNDPSGCSAILDPAMRDSCNARLNK